jgi:spermidine synthase
MKKISLYALFFLSGLSGLGYEILWTRMLSVSLGHEIVSVLAVISAFFSGLAIGGWLLDGPVSRSTSPGKWYAFLEVTIGAWALALMFLLPALNDSVSHMIGVEPSALRHWTISFVYPFIILLPATVAMGGTLPAMDRIFEWVQNESQAVAGLYSVNTFGAVAGTFAVTFLLMPLFGMKVATLALSGTNFLVAAGVFLSARNKEGSPLRKKPHASPFQVRQWHFYAVLIVTGLLGIGFEVLMVRVLSQIFENTVFSFASMLMVFLFGTAMGAGVYQKGNGKVNGENGLSRLLLLTSFFCLLSIFLLRFVEPLFQHVQTVYGQGAASAIAVELTVSFLFFLLPAAAMGATFSHLARALRKDKGGVGKALCLNTLGGAAAPLLFGVMLLPKFGIVFSLLIIPTLYLACIPGFRRVLVTRGALVAAIILFAVLEPAEHYRFVTISKGDTVMAHKDGVMASVSVVKDNRGALHLKVNNRFQMGGTTSIYSDRRQAFLPLLLHKNPGHALFLGLGTGATFAAAGIFPDLQADGVELVPEVIDVMGYFEKATGNLASYTNLRIVNADARRYVTATHQPYDVVIADLFHPARDGAGSLYTVEHFEAIRKLLTEDGLFCQWLPLYQLDLETFKTIIRTFLQVFPEGQAFLAHYSVKQPIIGLVGARNRLRYSENWYDKRVPGRQNKRYMAGYGYDSVYSLLGTFLSGAEILRAYAGDGPVNTDAFPVVTFQAPRFVYGKTEPAGERLQAVLAALSPPDPEAILAKMITEEDYLARERLQAYWRARDSFLALGAETEQTSDVIKLYETVSASLLEVVRKSRDFSAAYDPLMRIAYELYPHDQHSSYELLLALQRANPTRPEAHILREKLFVDH